jgi:thiamine biosynthesis lipoprotein
MGTLVTITLYADSDDQAQAGFVAAFARIAKLDSILSDYKPESELSRVCESRTPLSPELGTVLVHAQKLARLTDGAFDITIGPLTRLWRQARAEKRLPDPDQLRGARERSGYRLLEISSDQVQCQTAGMQLDAGGIAKGYAADESLAALRRAGIRSALVAVSGDLAMGDPPPGREGWRVLVQTEVLCLANAAVSTSGDEFQFVEIDGARYSHILDPRTGAPLREAGTVSVIAGSGMEADSLATVISVLGEMGARFLARPVRRLPSGQIYDVRR